MSIKTNFTAINNLLSICEGDMKICSTPKNVSSLVSPLVDKIVRACPACKMLGQMLKSWNFNLSLIFLAFQLCLSYYM